MTKMVFWSARRDAERSDMQLMRGVLMHGMRGYEGLTCCNLGYGCMVLICPQILYGPRYRNRRGI